MGTVRDAIEEWMKVSGEQTTAEVAKAMGLKRPCEAYKRLQILEKYGVVQRAGLRPVLGGHTVIWRYVHADD